MEIVRTTILKRGIKDTLWPEIVLVMIHVKNLRPSQALEDFFSLIKKQDNILSSLQHPRVLGSTIYLFQYEEKSTLKSAKWDVKALRGKLVGFDDYTIYRVHFEE